MWLECIYFCIHAVFFGKMKIFRGRDGVHWNMIYLDSIEQKLNDLHLAVVTNSNKNRYLGTHAYVDVIKRIAVNLTFTETAIINKNWNKTFCNWQCSLTATIPVCWTREGHKYSLKSYLGHYVIVYNPWVDTL